MDIKRLLQAVQELSLATRLAEVQAIVRTAARDLAACDGATFVLRDGDQCYYADEDAIEPLWKGKRFPMETCISGWTMLHCEHAVIPDIYVDDRIPHDAYRPTFVRSLVMTPIRTMAPIGAIGAYWSQRHDATTEEISLLRALADATSLALEKVSIHIELEQEVALAVEVRRMAQTDELTGLLNRRGFADSVALLFAGESGSAGAVAFVDLDGLKLVNDLHGHDAGDRLIVDVAEILRTALRPDDVLARHGGDEFTIFSPGMDAEVLEARLALAIGSRGSVGTAALTAADQMQAALLTADGQMYQMKRARQFEAARRAPI